MLGTAPYSGAVPSHEETLPLSRPTAPGDTGFRAFVPERRFHPTVAFSPDGTLIAYSTNVSGQFNLWVTDLAGQARQLTDYTENAVRDVAFSPDGTTLVFAADHHGNEQHQLYLVPVGGGAPERLTDTPDRQFDLAAAPFSPDGRFLVHTGNDRDERCKDVILRDLRTGGSSRIETTPGLWHACSVSPDGRWLLVLRANGNTDTDLHLVDLHRPDPVLTPVTAHEGEISHRSGPWTADSSGFHLRSDEGGEFHALRLRSLTGETTTVDAPGWDVEGVVGSRDASTLAWLVNEGGVSRLRVRRDGVDVPVPDLPAGRVLALDLSADGTRAAVLVCTATRPTDLVLVDVEAGTAAYLTDSRPPALLATPVVRPEPITYPTHDGLAVPAWLYRPAGEGPFPFLLSVHGGPETQERPDYPYSGLYQYLLSRGIGVLAPNVRGSTGYGKGYQRRIHRDWGGAELGDLEHAVLHLHDSGVADPARIAVFGASFGGFAALSCLSRLPGYWAAGVSVVGPSNLVTLARSVPPTWRSLMASWIGDPDTEAEFLLERSPITYADRIVAPLMVVQGANDPRVARAESDQIVEALRGRGVEVRYDVYPDEGHGFTDRANEIRALNDVADFLVEHLLRA